MVPYLSRCKDVNDVLIYKFISRGKYLYFWIQKEDYPDKLYGIMKVNRGNQNDDRKYVMMVCLW